MLIILEGWRYLTWIRNLTISTESVDSDLAMTLIDRRQLIRSSSVSFSDLTFDLWQATGTQGMTVRTLHAGVFSALLTSALSQSDASSFLCDFTHSDFTLHSLTPYHSSVSIHLTLVGRELHTQTVATLTPRTEPNLSPSIFTRCFFPNPVILILVVV